MRRFKKFMAAALAATMVIGSSVIASAATGTSQDSGSQEATGTPEGHLDTTVYLITLPTVPEGTFNYNVDPERLVALSNGKLDRYATKEFTQNAKDNGVYFTVSGGDYFDSTSEAVEITNQSSVDMDITVSVAVDQTNKATDIKLVDTIDNTKDDTAQLKLVLKVTGEDDATLDAEKGASTTTTLTAGDNYERSVSGNNYIYVPKADADWAKTSFSLAGVASIVDSSKVSTAATAPKLTITWKYAPKTTDAEPSIGTTSYTADGSADVAITLNFGGGSKAATEISEITFKSTTGETKILSNASYSLDGSTLKISKSQISAWINAGLSSREYSIKFNDTAETVIKVTVTKQ